MHTKVNHRILPLAVLGASVFAVISNAAADQSLTITLPSHGVHGNPPNFCEYTIVSGQLQGGSSGVKVELFENPYPFTAGFKSAGLSAVTDSAGNYSIRVTARVLTDYHVIAATSPPIQSADIRERARSCADVHASDRTPKRGQLVRFFGTVTPAKDGRRIGFFLPRSEGKRSLGATLRHNNASSSKFSLSVRVFESGYYGVELRADKANELGGGGIDLRVHR